MSVGITKYLGLLDSRRFIVLTAGLFLFNFGAFAGVLSSWNAIFLIMLDMLLGLGVGAYSQSFRIFAAELLLSVILSSILIHLSFLVIPGQLRDSYFVHTNWWPQIFMCTFFSVCPPAMIAIAAKKISIRWRKR